MKIQKLLLLFITVWMSSSCRKEIQLKLNNAENKLVIEGNITDQPGPYQVKLSRTVWIDQENTFPSVSGAFITVSDNIGHKDTLTEVNSGVYQTKTIQGEPNRTYTLQVSVNNQTVYATSWMPPKVNLDSLTFLPSSFGSGPGVESYLVPIPHFLDPVFFGNDYRFILTKNETLDKGIYVDTDNLINGLQYQRPIFSNDLPCRSGDSLVLEMQCISPPIYHYFYSLNEIIGAGPGGGSTPSNPETNLSGEALGYFSAHTVQKLSVIVP